MIAGTINGVEFSIEWKGKGKGILKCKDIFVNYMVSTSRRVRVYDPYKSTAIHADMMHSEYEAWLILNKMNGERDIVLELTRTDIRYESEYLEPPEGEQTKIIDR